MNLIITSPARLRAVYGERGRRDVLEAIERLVAARAARGVPSRVLAVEQGDPALGVAGADVTPAAIAGQIAAITQARQPQQSGAIGDEGSIASVLIVGGPDVVPFVETPNPAAGDGDETVPGDWIYGGSGPLAGAAWPVGRIPGAAGTDPSLLIRLLDFAAGSAPAPARRKAFGYCTAAWRGAAEQVYAEIDAPERMLISPPSLATTFDRQQLDGARLLYVNLHGVRDGPSWYGQAEEPAVLVAALRPTDLAGLDLRGAVVISEACYGAAIAGRNEDTSLALAFLARGAAGFVGATTISYGPPTPPPGEADLIAQHFLRAATRPGSTLGAAFAAARAGMLRDTLAHQQTLDEDDQKTLMQFVLYGDPTIVISSQ